MSHGADCEDCGRTHIGKCEDVYCKRCRAYYEAGCTCVLKSDYDKLKARLDDLEPRYAHLKMVFSDQCDDLRKIVDTFDSAKYLGRKLSGAMVEEFKIVKEKLGVAVEALRFYYKMNAREAITDLVEYHSYNPLVADAVCGTKAREALHRIGENVE